MCSWSLQEFVDMLYGIRVSGASHKHPGDADEGDPHFEKLIQKEPSAGRY